MSDVVPNCVRLFGAVRGAELHELIERETQAACPCVAGYVCPLLGPESSPSLVLAVLTLGQHPAA